MHLYEQIRDEIRERILSGFYREGVRLPGIRVLAGEFSTTVVTINRVIGDLESMGLIRRVAKSGCYVTAADSWGGENRTGRETGLAGVIAFDTQTSSFWANATEAIEDALRVNGLHMVVGHSDHEVERAIEYVHELDRKGIDGFVFVPLDADSPEEFCRSNSRVIAELRATKKPFVLFDRSVPGEDTSSVTNDHYAEAIPLVEYLVESGCRNPLYLTPRYSMATGARRRAFIDVLNRHGYDKPEDRVEVINRSSIRPEDFPELEAILNRHPECDGFFTCTGSMARLLNRVLDEGRDPSNRLPIVGFSRARREDAPPRLRYVARLPAYDYAYAAGKLLALLIKGSQERFWSANTINVVVHCEHARLG